VIKPLVETFSPPGSGMGSDESGNYVIKISYFSARNNGYTFVHPLATLRFMPIKTKDAGLRLRVEKELRQEFIETCRASGKPAAQVLREFMRDFVTRERVMIQRPLFEEGQR
jgi:ABC-type dipeptide/oligopeptide/nickel transport system permease component